VGLMPKGRHHRAEGGARSRGRLWRVVLRPRKEGDAKRLGGERRIFAGERRGLQWFLLLLIERRRGNRESLPRGETGSEGTMKSIRLLFPSGRKNYEIEKRPCSKGGEGRGVTTGLLPVSPPENDYIQSEGDGVSGTGCRHDQKNRFNSKTKQGEP